MEFNEATYDKIYKHLHNQLTKADEQDFELLMAQNPDLVGEIDKHKKAETMVLDNYLLEVRTQTQQLLQQKRQQANLKKWLGGGSMVLLLSAGIAAYINFTQDQLSYKAQLPDVNTLKNSSIESKTQPSPTLEAKKPVSAVTKAIAQPKANSQKEQVPSPTVDLDKEAQLLYLKQLEQQQKSEPLKSKDINVPVTITPAVNETNPEDKQVIVVEQDKPVHTVPQELLFDLAYEPKVGNPLEIPTGDLEEGIFKIIDQAGVVVYEAYFDSQNKPIWNGQFKSGSLSQNKQLNVLMFNNKNLVQGLGKISVIQ